jgi:CRISPR system Cascade subunit CasB
LAQLRRGVGKTVAQTPFLWADIIRPDAGTREDWANDAQETATHIALTLWALHSQGPGSKANQDGIPFARALRALDAEVGGDTVRAHFASLLAARNDVVRERHLRSLVGLMHSRAIGFDYPDLAADLADLRSAFKADGVRRRWGRQYVGAITPPTSEPTTSQE